MYHCQHPIDILSGNISVNKRYIEYPIWFFFFFSQHLRSFINWVFKVFVGHYWFCCHCQNINQYFVNIEWYGCFFLPIWYGANNLFFVWCTHYIHYFSFFLIIFSHLWDTNEFEFSPNTHLDMSYVMILQKMHYESSMTFEDIRIKMCHIFIESFIYMCNISKVIPMEIDNILGIYDVLKLPVKYSTQNHLIRNFIPPQWWVT